jgi:hypothetical protein
MPWGSPAESACPLPKMVPRRGFPTEGIAIQAPGTGRQLSLWETRQPRRQSGSLRSNREPGAARSDAPVPSAAPGHRHEPVLRAPPIRARLRPSHSGYADFSCGGLSCAATGFCDKARQVWARNSSRADQTRPRCPASTKTPGHRHVKQRTLMPMSVQLKPCAQGL